MSKYQELKDEFLELIIKDQYDYDVKEFKEKYKMVINDELVWKTAYKDILWVGGRNILDIVSPKLWLKSNVLHHIIKYIDDGFVWFKSEYKTIMKDEKLVKQLIKSYPLIVSSFSDKDFVKYRDEIIAKLRK